MEGLTHPQLVRPPKPSIRKASTGKKVFCWILGILGAGLLLISLAINMLLIMTLFGSRVVAIDSSAHAERDYKEILISGTGRDKIVVVPIVGIIRSGEDTGIFFSRCGAVAEQIICQLRFAKNDEDVKALILQIDSPGGGITASDMIYNEVLKVKKNGKKIVVSMGDVAASGGYYVASAADKIVAHPTTITGSIGVIIRWANIQGLYEKIGIQENNIKSGPKKDMLSPTRAITEEERQILQGMLDQMYARFIHIVAKGRDMSLEKVKLLSDGRIYTGEQALNNGLVDMNGYFEDAIELAKDLAGLTEARVVRYKKVFSLADFFNATLSHRLINFGINFNLHNSWIAESPRFMYLWTVGGYT